MLEGSGRKLMFASGMAGPNPGTVLTEEHRSPFVGPDSPRGGSENLALSFADRGIAPVSLRFSPTVHGKGDHGFTAELVRVARERGVSAYIGDGSTRWAAVHRFDTARMIALALQKAPAGTITHAAAEEGIASRSIAEAIANETGSRFVRVNAVMSNVAELREILAAARRQPEAGTILFIDELHRFNKSQQDLLLPDV